ncbi:hypothetical protein [Cellvibrio sp. PSBB023]|uniref:hypothetical protein n=1 Tax=Cellvibrio sp. PSBB023 TaxID=1945512 RepID=UPI00098FB7E5|nr:hypothetical protein [Cellvibrio sp. PSBB023]AQT61417.1 hypothetical protein B0D95_15865 [Cellvibrio sp. PSBB023]
MKKDILNCPLRILCFVCLSTISCALFSQEPLIDSVEGNLTEGAVVTLKGGNFTYKINPKPLLFWSADQGEKPSILGRKQQWDGVFTGSIVDKAITDVIASGSKKVLRHDYSTGSGALLAKVSFDSDRLYVWRKRYDDFDRLKDVAIRTRYKSLEKLGAASTVSVGMLMSTANKAIQGKVVQAETSGATAGTVYYANNYGNILDRTLTASIGTDEVMYFYAESDKDLKTPLFKALIDEGKGIFYTFNHKIFRMWGKHGSQINNTYISLDSDGVAVSEYTQVKTFWMGSWDNKINSATKRWVVEEFQYQAGTIDKEDGILFYWQDRVKAWEQQRFRFTTSAYPNKYSDVYQTQVSNGAQPGSFEYFDSLYIDDTWHRVYICSERTWFACTQPEVVIPVSWSDNEIKVNLRLGALHSQPRFYFYVVNADGSVNSVGFSSCPKCPEPPFAAQ